LHPRRLSKIAVSMLIALVLIPTLALFTTLPTAYTQQQEQLPRVALAKLWSVSHDAYMAKFYGEDYVVVCTSHCDVSLDGRFISSYGTAYIYKVKTGTQLGSLSGPGTWRVDSWEPFKATKVSSYSGFFSADSKKMAPDLRVHGGTGVKGVNSTDTWSYTAVDWGFTDTNGDHYYAIQLDYDGDTLAVGYIGTSWASTGWNDTSKLLVYKYDPTQNKYTKVYEYATYGDYGRRLQMTLDGKVIVVGGIGYPYIDIHIYSDASKSYRLAVHYRIPDTGGVSALGISDPYRVGYIIAGTLNGWIIVARYDTTTGEFKVVYQAKLAPDNSWLYNPFYDRWIPRVTDVFALCSHRDSSRAGYAIIYDVLTNTTTVINFAGAGTPQWSAATVSPEANYVFIGNTLYMVIKRDAQARASRARLWGTLIAEYPFKPLNTSVVLAPPKGLDVLMFSGKITVSRIYTEPIPIDLVTDPDIVNGRLAAMADKGLVTAQVLKTEYSDVQSLKVLRGYEFRDDLASQGISEYSNYIATLSTTVFKPPPYFWEGNTYFGTVVRVPLTQNLKLFNEMRLELASSIHTANLLYDKNKRALGIIGIPVEIGGGVGVSALAYSKLADTILLKFAVKDGVLNLGRAFGIATSQTVAKIAGVVGIAVAIWGGIDAALVEWGGLGEANTQNWVVIAPTVVDQYGRKFTAVMLYLPLEESQNIQSYYNIIKTYFSSLGYTDVGLQVTYIGQTWSEYKKRLEAGFTPIVNLYELIRTTIASQYGLDMNALTATGVDILIVTRVRAKETFWEWFFGLGGVNINTLTLVGASTIKVKGVLKSGIVTDPTAIANTLGKVYVNDAAYELKPGRDGAYTEFGIQLGTPKLVFRFEQPIGFYGDIRVEIASAVKSPFQDTGYSYTTTLNYNWEGTQIILSKIELVDMPKPAIMIERVFRHAYGEFVHDLTKYFTLQTVIDDPSSPTGKLYYYITTSTLIFDPANGGILQPGKSFTINYYYAKPPDVSVKVFLNGTRVTSSLAHHATVAIYNNAPKQDVAIAVRVAVKYLKGVEEIEIMSRNISDTLTAPANGTAYKTYDISDYVYRAIVFMNSTNIPTFVEVYARIVDAKYNYIKNNDEDRVVYYPPLTIVRTLPIPSPGGVPGLRGNYTVTVNVEELDNKTYTWRPSANALVEVLMGNISIAKKYTNETGYTSFILSGGVYTFRASKPGYTNDSVTITIYENTFITLRLVPGKGVTPRVTVGNATNIVFVNVTNVKVTFYVYNASSGNPVAGATVKLTYVEPTNSSFYGMIFSTSTGVDGYAVLEIPAGRYRVEVYAAGFKNYTSYIPITFDTVVNIALEPLEVPPNYYTLEVYTYYYGRKFPMPGVNITVVGDAVNITTKTDSRGYARFVLKGGVTYTVKASVLTLAAKPYTLTKTVTLTKNETIVFEFPWYPSPFPSGNAYIIVNAKWSNGKPFKGATICIVNATSGTKVVCDETDSLGEVEFLIPAFQVYYVTIEATNPYNTSQRYTSSTLLNLALSSVSMGGIEFVTITGFKLSFTVPWVPPEMPSRYYLYVYAYNALTGLGIEDVYVVAARGSEVWFTRTNATGYAKLTLPYLGLFEITASHPLYKTVTRKIMAIENNTLLNLPMVPIPANFTLPTLPPANGTYPAIVVNNVSYYWLSVQVTWSDGYPFHNAEVRVYNTTSGALIARGVTNGTGFVHFLIRANASIKYIVYAVNPFNRSQVYNTSKTLVMNQHYFFVHQVPWVSKYYAPEVAVVDVDLAIHRGQGYFYGNVSHLVFYSIWTNKPQNITVFIALYNMSSDPPKLINSKTASLSLTEGVNIFMDWLSVNISKMIPVRAFVNITKWQYDTDPSNNYMWSPARSLKPFTDFRVIALWRPKQVKQSWTLLPGDVIEIDIGIYIPINTSAIPLKLDYSITAKNLTLKVFKPVTKKSEEIKTTTACIVWRNFTVAIPWTSRITINVSIYHSLDDVSTNNNITIAIPIDPNIKLSIAKYTSYVIEGGDVSITVYLKSNIEAETGAIAWVTIEDNTTATIVKRVEIPVEPEKTVEVRFKAPQNPPMMWIIRRPTQEHILTTSVTGYDTYLADNSQSIKITVVSYQWIAAVIAIAAIIIIIAAISRAIRKSIAMSIEDEMEYVKRKRFVHRKH